ncbi:MAG: alpha/beta hydrolase [Anaerolineaceae bacterium]|nr:alpha/beta hydrolase [Anaerolineaceae bacterium]
MMTTVAEWRESGAWVQVGAHRIFTRVVGKGSSILVLHGFPTASYDYARLAPLLADRYRLILLDFLGFGFSDKPRPHAYSLFEQADVAAAVAAHYDTEQCAILTHDMGNSVALELLKRRALDVSQVVMFNGSVLLRYYRPLITQRLLLNQLTGPAIAALRLIRKPTFARQFGSVFAQQPNAAEIDAFWSLIQYNNGLDVYHRLIRYLNERKMHEYAWLEALAQHPAPLTVIWGQRDPVSMPRIAQAVLEYRPDAVYFPLDAVGHYPHWEAPEFTAGLIREALG